MSKSIFARLVVMSALGITPLLLAGDMGLKANFVGGTVAAMSGVSGLRIDLTGEQALLLRSKSRSFEIPFDKIHLVEYGQRASRRYAAALVVSPILLLSKSRKHFLTLGYTDEKGDQQALVLRVDKDDIRSALVGLEAKTGRKVEYQDDEARRSGRG
jgi:hypothetical protein